MGIILGLVVAFACFAIAHVLNPAPPKEDNMAEMFYFTGDFHDPDSTL